MPTKLFIFWFIFPLQGPFWGPFGNLGLLVVWVLWTPCGGGRRMAFPLVSWELGSLEGSPHRGNGVPFFPGKIGQTSGNNLEIK